MPDILLKLASPQDGEDVYSMLQRIGRNENAFNNEANGMSYKEYQIWLIQKEAWSEGRELPEGYVKEWTYWLMVDDLPVGYGKLREKITEKSREYGGNIGYAVDPLQRRKGYGNKLFALLLKKAKEKGIHEILSTVQKPNYISKGIQEKNGGRLIGENTERWYFLFNV